MGNLRGLKSGRKAGVCCSSKKTKPRMAKKSGALACKHACQAVAAKKTTKAHAPHKLAEKKQPAEKKPQIPVHSARLVAQPDTIGEPLSHGARIAAMRAAGSADKTPVAPLKPRRGRPPKKISEYNPEHGDDDPSTAENDYSGLEYDTGIQFKNRNDDNSLGVERSEDSDEELNFDW